LFAALGAYRFVNEVQMQLQITGKVPASSAKPLPTRP